MPDMLERKSFDYDCKAASTDDKMRFEGYLAKFDNVDSYGDIILKGAFAKTLDETAKEGKTIPILEQHGGWGMAAIDNTPLGYFEDLKEDDSGLYVKGVLFSTTRGSDMYRLLKEAPKGAMGMSIGFRTIGQRLATEDEYRTIGVRRYLTELKLLEGSIVTFPANEEARVEDVKSEALRWRELEKHFRKNGFSSSEAVKAVSLVKSFNVPVQKDIQEDNDDGIELLNEAVQMMRKFSDDMSVDYLRRSIKDVFASVK